MHSPTGPYSLPWIFSLSNMRTKGPDSNLLVLDPVQAPSLRHAFELVNAAIPKADARLRHQILDRARNQDFAGTRFRGNARADVKRETENVSSAHFVFARVQPH